MKVHRYRISGSNRMLLIVIIAIIVQETCTLESQSPSQYLQPRDFNPHPYYSLHQEPSGSSAVRNGPVLFPADSVPSSADRKPLVVTGRPLVPPPPSSPPPPTISRSRLGPYYHNDYSDLDTIVDKYNRFRYGYNITDEPNSYSTALERNHGYYTSDTRSNDYSYVEEQTALPPIFDSLGNFIKKQTPGGKKKHKISHETNTIESPTGSDYDDVAANEAKQYAFSYSVKDQNTGDDFSHTQRHLGSATKGEYRVKLPDGRVQIVSYTADNGGYKADVRYEEDKELSDNLVHENVVSTTTQRTPSPYQHIKSELGRIVVPSQEEKDYQDVEYVYYYDDDIGHGSSTTSRPHLVTNENKELLITSKPGYIYTTTQSPIEDAKQYLYPDTNIRNNYAVTPTPIAFVTTNRIDANPSSKKYLHFYDAESVKFVSTTPNYYRVSSTPASRYNVDLGNAKSSRQDSKPITEESDKVGLGRYYNPQRDTLVDYRKYFTFNHK